MAAERLGNSAAITLLTKIVPTFLKTMLGLSPSQPPRESEPQADKLNEPGKVGNGERTPDNPKKNMRATASSRNDHYQPTQIESSTRFATRCHPDANAICEELDGFFAQHWPWSDQKACEEFLKADLNRWTCWVYPLARSDRIFDIAKLITVLFLLDDVAEETSFEDGKALYKRIISIAQGKVQPDRNKPIEWITYDVWAKMRSVDEALT
ncbi:MAG: hypothetical protein Q9198_009393, partial [Flavoplaca austrocitrina]